MNLFGLYMLKSISSLPLQEKAIFVDCGGLVWMLGCSSVVEGQHKQHKQSSISNPGQKEGGRRERGREKRFKLKFSPFISTLRCSV